ncbi:hypothetical protein LXM94_24250 [Rhizobium sp. TRM95111]|nr:hypothetical protein [Rhizobium alarense]MCF3643077.1 hypothetical protein [Rhizobium alarense]
MKRTERVNPARRTTRDQIIEIEPRDGGKFRTVMKGPTISRWTAPACC